jgi:extradiol dioxygenase family protein
MQTFIVLEHGVFDISERQKTEEEVVIDFYGHGMHELLSIAKDVVHEINLSKESPVNLEDFTIIKAIVLK